MFVTKNILIDEKSQCLYYHLLIGKVEKRKEENF